MDWGGRAELYMPFGLYILEEVKQFTTIPWGHDDALPSSSNQQVNSQNIKPFLIKAFLLSYLVYNQIWLNFC
jgi:hypothetical protein